MLLSQFQKIQEIDQKLNELHNQRTKLFNAEAASQAQRPAGYFPAVPSAEPPAVTSSLNTKERWVQQTYAELVAKWQTRGIKAPKLNNLRARLEQAHEILDQISVIKPELHGKMTTVLVPPDKDIEYSAATDAKLKKIKPLHLSQEFIEAKFKKQNIRKSWRVIVAFSEAEGVYIGTPKQLLNEKHYLIAGYDAYGLGLHEYSALVLQEFGRVDAATWTVLLQGCAPKSNIVPAVKFENGHYLFSTETAISPFGDIRFRPAIEIT